MSTKIKVSNYEGIFHGYGSIPQTGQLGDKKIIIVRDLSWVEWIVNIFFRYAPTYLEIDLAKASIRNSCDAIVEEKVALKVKMKGLLGLANLYPCLDLESNDKKNFRDKFIDAVTKVALGCRKNGTRYLEQVEAKQIYRGARTNQCDNWDTTPQGVFRLPDIPGVSNSGSGT